MLGLLFQDILEPGHLVSDHAASLFGFEMVDFPFVVLDLLVDIFEFLLDDFGGGLGRDELVLLLDGGLLLLLIEHFVNLDDFVLELSVALFQLLYIFGPALGHMYLISSDSLSFYFMFCLLLLGVSKNSLLSFIAFFRLLLFILFIIIQP